MDPACQALCGATPRFIREARVKVSAARAEQVPGVCRFQTRSTHRDPGPDATREIIGWSVSAWLFAPAGNLRGSLQCQEPHGLAHVTGFLALVRLQPMGITSGSEGRTGGPKCCELSSLLIVLCAWAAQNSPYAVCPAQLQHGVRFGM